MAFNEEQFLKTYTQKSGGFDIDKFASQYGGYKTDTKTSQGLYNLAVQSGLQREADRAIQANSGEETKKIFSGGFISDIFDTLNALQYGVVGTLKGKGFIEGVKTRQSFSDKDALGDYGLPGVVAGIALDIAVDPLTYIAPATIAKKIPGLTKGLTALKEFAFGKKVLKVASEIPEKGLTNLYQEIEGGTKAGKWLADKFVYMFGKDPIYRRMYEKSVSNIATGTQNIVDMSRGLAKLTPEVSKKILTKDETGRIVRVGLKQLQKTLTPEEFAQVAPAWNKIDELGQQAVDLGLLSKGKFEENFGEYIKNAYTEYELTKKKGLFGFMKTGVKGIKKRVEGLTTEEMAKLGQIDNPAYLVFKSAFDLTKDVENAKLFKATAERFGQGTIKEGFKQLPSGKRLGDLAGKYVPENIYNAIQEITEPVKDVFGKELVGNFKFAKVIMNPASWARNAMSNQILNWWKLGMNPLDPKSISANAEAAKEIFKRGGKWIDEAKTVGYGVDTFSSQELYNIIDNPEMLDFTKKIGSKISNFKKVMGNIYQGEENQAKLAAFIFNRNKGMGIEDAWKAAESATFNYAQVTPFVRKLRTAIWGAPFITFTVKSTPVVAETIMKTPGRVSVIGKIKQAIESQSDIKETDRERASEPAYIRDGFYIKLPMKDKNGNSAYFDLTYIIPFGDLIAGNFFERQTNRETGLPESVPSAVASKSPLFNFLKEISKNQDFYGDKIWKESDSTDKQVGDLMRHISKTYLPPLVADQIPGGYKSDGTRRQKGIIGALSNEQKAEQQRTLMQEMLRQVGAKTQPIDADIQETYQEWNRKKALETLLRERGILKEYSASYIPK